MVDVMPEVWRFAGNAPLLVVLIGDRLVDVSPPDVLGGARFVDDAFVVGATSGLFARHRHHGARVGNRSALLVLQRQLVKPGWRGISDNIGYGDSV